MAVVLRGLRQGVYEGGFRMTTQNKNTVIEALIERFGKPLMYQGHCVIGMSESQKNTALIRASCENIYQSGYLQGKYDALEESLKACKGEKL